MKCQPAPPPPPRSQPPPIPGKGFFQEVELDRGTGADCCVFAMLFRWRVLGLFASLQRGSEHVAPLLTRGRILNRSSSYVVLGEGKNVSKERNLQINANENMGAG